MLRHTFYVVAAECCIAHVERIWIVEPYIVIVNEACADSQVRYRTIVRRAQNMCSATEEKQHQQFPPQ